MRHGSRRAGLDGTVTNWVVDGRSDLLTSLMRAVTWLGSMAVIAPLTLVVIALLLATRRRVLALYLFICVFGGALLSDVLKPIIGRDRPPSGLRLAGAGGASFPSGHAVQATTAYLALAVVVTVLVASRHLRVAAWITASVVILLVGVSRVYLGVHWTTDVLAGWLLGALWVGLVTFAFRGRWLRERGWQAVGRAE